MFVCVTEKAAWRGTDPPFSRALRPLPTVQTWTMPAASDKQPGKLNYLFSSLFSPPSTSLTTPSLSSTPWPYLVSFSLAFTDPGLHSTPPFLCSIIFRYCYACVTMKNRKVLLSINMKCPDCYYKESVWCKNEENCIIICLVRRKKGFSFYRKF